MAIVKGLYLLLVKFISLFTYQKQLEKDMIVAVVDFHEDLNEFLIYMKEQDLVRDYRIAVFYNPRISRNLIRLDNVLYFEKKFTSKLKMIRYLQKPLFILVDSYVPEMGVIRFNSSKICFQIWHANGALKKFGLDSARPYKKQDIQRFLNVYKQYDKILVGSEKMKKIFKNSFHIEDDQRFLPIGVLRMDKYFKPRPKSGSTKNSALKADGGKVILYAPTYREHGNSNEAMASLLKEMGNLKKHGYKLVVRTHPTVTYEIPEEDSGFIINGNKIKLKELMLSADILITDYSSLAMEFSISNKPIYFYSYDIEEYRIVTGLLEDYETQICSDVYRDARKLQEAILNEAVKTEDVQVFNEKWNTYTSGSACASLLSYMELRKEKYEITN